MEDWKAKLGAAFQVAVPSDEEIKQAQEQATAGVPKGDALAQQGKHMVNVLLDKKGRTGKQATLVTDRLCNAAALKALAATLKKHCGVGGSARDGEILIQGDRRQQVLDFLTGQGFKARII